MLVLEWLDQLKNKEGKMNFRWFLIIILLLIFNCFEIISQTKFSTKSGSISLNIKIPPPDTVIPYLTVNLPPVKENYTINWRDSIFYINGLISDNSNKIKIFVNNNFIGNFVNGQYSTFEKLNLGENILRVTAIDKKGNKSEKVFKVNYDPKADITPPQIKLLPPFDQLNRGIQIIRRNQLENDLILTGRVIDESEVIDILINGIPADSIVGEFFYFNFKKSIPDSVSVFVSDKYGNYNEVIATVKLEDYSYFENNPDSVCYYAILIAVENYSDQRINNLDYPIKNTNNLARVLKDYYKFDSKNITVLKNPKRSNIISAFQKLRDNLSEKDNLLIFYAGHGYFDAEQDMGYWLPSDAQKDDYSNWLPNSTIRDFIKSINTKHTLLISDACFAGSIFSSREPLIDASRSILEIYKVRSRKAMTSGIKNQKVEDNSKFTEFLIKFLIENKEKYVTAQEIFTRVRAAVLNNSSLPQTPEFGSIPFTGDEGLSGDFIFIKK
jgi:hypothetical protein